jgi:adenylate kinase
MKKPNILITGTPGTGKTSTSETVAEKLQFRHLNVGDFVKEHDCQESYDSTFDTHILDEDKLLDLMEPIVEKGGVVVDYHSCELFPERWFDLVIVLRTVTNVLYERLVERGYNQKKLNENMECEIMQVVLEAAKESYTEEIVHECPSATIEDLESNVERIESWYQQWKLDNN